MLHKAKLVIFLAGVGGLFYLLVTTPYPSFWAIILGVLLFGWSVFMSIITFNLA